METLATILDAPITWMNAATDSDLRAGPVDYYCRFHPNMTGHIDVR